MKKFLKREIYYWPLAAAIFFLSFHFYNFYAKDFGKIFIHVKPDLSVNQYDAIQEQNPYFEIYRVAMETENSGKNVYYFSTEVGEKFIDYTSTLYANRGVTDPRKVKKKYLSELNARIDYFFYPRRIKPVYDPREFRNIDINTGDIIISDMNLEYRWIELLGLSEAAVIVPELKRINRWKDIFFIYQRI